MGASKKRSDLDAYSKPERNFINQKIARLDFLVRFVSRQNEQIKTLLQKPQYHQHGLHRTHRIHRHGICCYFNSHEKHQSIKDLEFIGRHCFCGVWTVDREYSCFTAQRFIDRFKCVLFGSVKKSEGLKLDENLHFNCKPK